VRLNGHNPRAAANIRNSARFLLSRGYDTVGWCGSNPRAAELWVASFAARAEAEKGAKISGVKPGRAIGLIFAPAGARILELERFAEAAWGGASRPKAGFGAKRN
jgi:hypothetical protein